MGWLIVFAAIVLLAFLPLGLRIRYDQDGLAVSLKIGFLRFLVYPSNKKNPEKKQKKQSADTEKSSPWGKGGSIKNFRPLLKVLLNFLKEIPQKITVQRLDVLVTLVGDDPCDLAQNYGTTCAAVAALEPQLERALNIRRKNIQIQCDFLESTPTVFFLTDISISFRRLISLLWRHGRHAVREYIHLKNKEEGGATL